MRIWFLSLIFRVYTSLICITRKIHSRARAHAGKRGTVQTRKRARERYWNLQDTLENILQTTYCTQETKQDSRQQTNDNNVVLSLLSIVCCLVWVSILKLKPTRHSREHTLANILYTRNSEETRDYRQQTQDNKQPIADRVAQNLQIISKNVQFSTKRTRILLGFIIYYLVQIVNPMGRILVGWIFFRNNLEMQCHPLCNWLYCRQDTVDTMGWLQLEVSIKL